VDLGPAAVGVLVGLSGLLLVVEPWVDPLAVGGTSVPAFVLSALLFPVALGLGAVVFARRGDRVAAVVHGGAGLGVLTLVGGTAVGSWAALLAGVALVAAVGLAVVTA